MTNVQKIHVKMTFKVTEEDRENFKADVPLINKLLNRKPGDELDKSKIVRAAIRNLHEALKQGFAPKWLIDYAEIKLPKTKRKTKE